MLGDESPWLTYREAAEALGVSRQAVRLRAIRGRWPRTKGNDGEARLQIPETSYRVRTAHVPGSDVSLVNSLREHIETLKAQLAEETAALRQHNATLKAELEHRGAEIDTLKAQLAASEERVTAADARASEESAKTAQAIAAFESLAQRLEAMAEARRPLWHRLLWRG
jgi:hypothetical protein